MFDLLILPSFTIYILCSIPSSFHHAYIFFLFNGSILLYCPMRACLAEGVENNRTQQELIFDQLICSLFGNEVLNSGDF